jgi:hypothetical protein
MPANPPNGRKVKSRLVGAGETTDRHERAKDYLSPTPGSTPNAAVGEFYPVNDFLRNCEGKSSVTRVVNA